MSVKGGFEFQKPGIGHHPRIHRVAQRTNGFMRSHDDFEFCNHAVGIQCDQINANRIKITDFTLGLIHNSGLTFQAQFPQPIPVTLF